MFGASAGDGSAPRAGRVWIPATSAPRAGRRNRRKRQHRSHGVLDLLANAAVVLLPATTAAPMPAATPFISLTRRRRVRPPCFNVLSTTISFAAITSSAEPFSRGASRCRRCRNPGRSRLALIADEAGLRLDPKARPLLLGVGDESRFQVFHDLRIFGRDVRRLARSLRD